MNRSLIIPLGLALAIASSATVAQKYPERPVRFVIPQAAGGSMDTNSRVLAEPLGRELGQNIVIDNRGGANGIIGGEAVARATPDGHTALYTSNSIINNQLIRARPPFDVLRDFVPITLVGKLPGYLVMVNNQVPVKTLGDLIEHSKKASEPVRYGSGGIGNSQHLLGTLINAKTGTRFEHVPYKGLPITPLLSNEIQLLFAAPTTMMAHIKSGRLKALAITSAKRWNGLPDVPATAEFIPGFAYEVAWHGMFAPAGTPAAIVNRLQQEVAKALRLPHITRHFENGGYIVVGSTPAEFRRYLADDLKNVREHMRLAGLKPE